MSKPRQALSDHRLRADCRGCGAAGPRRFLSLGKTALANAFLRSSEEFAAERTFPLDVYVCERCTLVQLLDVIDPALLFSEYLYVTGTSDTMRSHYAEYASSAIAMLDLGPEDLVLEVASNDGSLLECFKARGVRTLGIEPAGNLAKAAGEQGIETVNAFFDEALGKYLRARRGPAKAVVANNVLAHVDDPRGFLRGCASLLSSDGMLIIEVPYLGELLERLEYDTIYHEHLCYFSVGALVHLFEASGLALVRVDRVSVHGGSLRLHARNAAEGTKHGAEVLQMAARERDEGMTSIERLARFASGVEENKRLLVELLETLRAEGHSLAAYGAPAKGNTLLNTCGIGPDLIPYTVDRNPLKVGSFTPGRHIPVLEVRTLIERQPDYVLILAWNVAEEILRQQELFRQRGGRFIVPIPLPRVI